MEMDKSLTISVIIPTKNRPDDLERTLESLMAQTVVPNELIIVDQSGNDQSKQATDHLIGRGMTTTRLKYIHDKRISGLAAARNRAMSLAECEIWLFLDDDVILEPNFLEELLSGYDSNGSPIGVSGIVTNYPHPAFTFQVWSNLFVRGPFHDDRQPIYWNADKLRNSGPLRVSRMGGGLMSFRGKAIQGFQFDENLSGVSDGEDVDFCARMPEGSLLIIVPRARLVHKASPAGRSRQHWLNRHARSNHFLYRKNWAGKKSNWVYFAWLNIGYCLVASLAVVRSASLRPWQDLLDGIEQGNRVGTARTCTLHSEEAIIEPKEAVNS